MRLILASKSPRRKKILDDLGYDVEVMPSDFDETKIKVKDPKKLVVELAYNKANLIAKKAKDAIIIAADTVVVYDGKIIGQQDDDESAKKTIMMLLGKTHLVYTGICVMNPKNKKIIKKETISKVTLKNISEKVLMKYIKSKQYLGKAGAYNIDDPEFKSFIESVDGSYTNIMGLPKEEIQPILKSMGA